MIWEFLLSSFENEILNWQSPVLYSVWILVLLQWCSVNNAINIQHTASVLRPSTILWTRQVTQHHGKYLGLMLPSPNWTWGCTGGSKWSLSLYSKRDQPVIVNWTLRLKLQLEINYFIFTQNKCSISSHILGSVFTPTLSRTQNVMMARSSNCTDNHSLPKQARMSGDNFQPNKQICSLVTGSLWETFRNKFNWSSDNAMSQVNDVPSHIWSLFIQMFSY